MIRQKKEWFFIFFLYSFKYMYWKALGSNLGGVSVIERGVLYG
nr:MAG TPA: hypothetical protein [Caudoviricetes sp.]